MKKNNLKKYENIIKKYKEKQLIKAEKESNENLDKNKIKESNNNANEKIGKLKTQLNEKAKELEILEIEYIKKVKAFDNLKEAEKDGAAGTKMQSEIKDLEIRRKKTERQMQNLEDQILVFKNKIIGFKYRAKKIKLIIYDILNPGNGGKKLSGRALNLPIIIDMAIMLLIILNVISVIAATNKNISAETQLLLNKFEFFSIIIFTVEYILRVWTSDCVNHKNSTIRKMKINNKYNPSGKYNFIIIRLNYMRSAMPLIDLISILPFYLLLLPLSLPFVNPFYLTVLRMVRLVRILRIFRLKRYSESVDIIVHVLLEKYQVLVLVAGAIFVLMIISAVLMYNLEYEAQPETFENIIDSSWWAIATMTTIGYGDIVPVTSAGKILGMVISFLGIGFMLVPGTVISSGYIERLKENKLKASHKADLNNITIIVNGVCVDDEDKIMIVKKRLGESNKWDFPGCNVLEDENMALAVRREFYDKTGLTVSIGQLLYLSDISLIEKTMRVTFMVKCVSGDLIELNDNSDFSEIEFVDAGNLENYGFEKNLIYSVKNYISGEAEIIDNFIMNVADIRDVVNL